MMIILKTKKDKKDFTKLTVIQMIGENNNDNLIEKYIEKYRDKCCKKNINFEWYVYPKNITTKELKQEIIDLLPFIDRMIFFSACVDYVSNEIQELFAGFEAETSSVLD